MRNFILAVACVFAHTCVSPSLLSGADAPEPAKLPSYSIHPVGKIEVKDSKPRIVIDKQFLPAMHGLSTWSHIWVVWWADKLDAPKYRSTLQEHPGENLSVPKVGVFASRVPVRPNLIEISACKIVSIKDNIIEVEKIDAYAGTPVLDIKPYADEDFVQDFRGRTGREGTLVTPKPDPNTSAPRPGLIGLLDLDRDGTLSAQEIAGVPETLKKLDKDGDGKVSREELGIPGNRNPPLFTLLDSDKDGVLSAQEIAAVPEALKKLDKNSDGKVSLDELGAYLGGKGPGGSAPSSSLGDFLGLDLDRGKGSLSPQEMMFASETLKRYDKNGDGKLTREELGIAKGARSLMFELLDLDKEGELSARSIAAAPETLKKRDKNGDGKLTLEELSGR